MNKKILRDVVDNAHVIPTKVVDNTRASFLSRERREERRANANENVLVNNQVQKNDTTNKRLLIIAGVLVLILVLFFILATIFSKANVTVHPKQEVVQVDSAIKIYRKHGAPLLISFDTKDFSDSASISVKTSGIKYSERKATGKVVVYNEYSKEPVRLIANTRFKSTDGKIFRSFTPISIPGQTTRDGKVVPGQIEISLTADGPGDEYNIPPSNFSVPGLANGPMARSVYARGITAFSGGFKGNLSVVSDKDLAEARSILEGKLTSELLTKAKSAVPVGKVFFIDAYSTTFLFNEFTAEDDSKTEGQKLVSMQGVLTAVFIDEGLLASSIARRELSTLGDSSVVIANWSELSADLDNYEALQDATELSIRVTGAAQFVWQFDEKDLIKELVGIEKNKYFEVFLNFPSIDKAEVKFRPFWTRRFPGSVDKIEVKVSLGQED